MPVEKGFNIRRPPIEPTSFVAEMTRAFADDAPTGAVPLDLSATLGTFYAATSPFMVYADSGSTWTPHTACQAE